MKVLRANADGTTEEVELTEAELNPSPSNAGLPPASTAPEATDDVLELLGDPDEVVVVSKTIEVAGQEKEFLIKRLSRKETDKINNQKYRREMGTGKISIAEDADINILAAQLHACVVKNVAEAGLKPVYEPRWTMEQIVGKNPTRNGKGLVTAPGKGGLLDNPSEAAEELIDRLQAAVWESNPAMNPLVLAQALHSLGMM